MLLMCDCDGNKLRKVYTDTHTQYRARKAYLEPHDLKSISSQSWLGSGAVFKDKAKPARAIYPSHLRSASRLDSTARGALKSCHRIVYIVQFSPNLFCMYATPEFGVPVVYLTPRVHVPDRHRVLRVQRKRIPFY